MPQCQNCGSNANFPKQVVCKKGCTYTVCQTCHSAPMSKMPKTCHCGETSPNWKGK